MIFEEILSKQVINSYFVLIIIPKIEFLIFAAYIFTML